MLDDGQESGESAELKRAAGGELTDFDGGDGYLERGNVVAGPHGVAAGIRAAAREIVSEESI